ncbi:MAG: glycoside hydrolase family 2 TIM barrel-domain containing protein [Bacteroidales bacterium]|nr:glycoside hydrolase family 2 TIM barrel-domain containing protein [Bacteroidales bacterium]
MKRTLFLTTALLVLVTGMLQAKPQFGKAQLFNNNWRFMLSEEKEGSSPTLDDSKWRKLDLPHDWSVEGTYSPDKASCTGYLPGGIGWYRKTFSVPESEKGNKVFIYFEGVYNHSEVFINGTSVGKRPNGYISFMYDLTPYLKFGQENVISVRVDHSLERDSRWYTGSGIYRDTYLVYASPVHLDLWGVYFKATNITDKKADFSIETSIKNELQTGATIQISYEITDPSTGKTLVAKSKNLKVDANSKATFIQNISVVNPKRWSLEQPNLYTLKTIVKLDGKIIDQNEQKIGFRTLTFDANKGFALNGLWTKVKGICIHHDAGCLGSAVPREVWKRRLTNLKEMGCNAIRLSHNPQAPDVYELCDEIGLLVMDEAFDEWEFPKRKWITGWNDGTPGFEGAAAFFDEWSDKDLADMVLRNRNHASIIMWSIGNEVDYPNDPYTHPVLDHASIGQPVLGGYLPNSPKAERLGVISKRLAAIVRSLDPSRPVTAARAGVVMSNETDYPLALDVDGYNYTEDRYAQDHAQYPKRVIYGSENRHGMEDWKAVRDNEYIFGQFLWTGIDYLGESGRWPARGSTSGLLNFGGFMKPRGHFREALWSTKPVTYIGTYPAPKSAGRNYMAMDALPFWNYTEGDMIRVVCYTNAPKSRLMLNGKQIGETKGLNDTTGIIHWDIPYQNGKLEVVGMDNADKQTCNFAIQSSDRPYALTAVSDVSSIKKGKGLAQIIVQVVDEKGIPVILSEDELRCTIDGPAKLLGLEASNNSDMGNYSDNVQRVYHGQLIAYIQASGNTGKITVKFTAPWLKDATVTIDAVE